MNNLSDSQEFTATMAAECPKCGGGPLSERTVDSIFWRGQDAVMIRDIPAMACQSCGEDFIDDRTVVHLDRMKGEGFSGSANTEFIRIPVFAFNGPTTRGGV